MVSLKFYLLLVFAMNALPLNVQAWSAFKKCDDRSPHEDLEINLNYNKVMDVNRIL